MRKLIYSLFLLLVAALIVAGAFLPRITAAITDNSTNGKAETAPMQSVELALGESSHEPLDMLRKLALADHMSTVPISADQAALTEEEVYSAVEKHMQDYAASGIFEMFTPTYTSVETLLAIDPYGTDNYGIIWTVNLVSGDGPYRSLFLHIDDETGKILFMDYETHGEDRFNYYPEYQSYVMGVFAGNFFSQLGLAEELQYMKNATVTSIATTQECSEVCYSFDDLTYGEINLYFSVYPNGFRAYYRD